MAHRLAAETFIEPCEDSFLVYAPLKGVAFTVNGSAAAFLRTLAQDGMTEISPEYRELFTFVEELGLVGGNEPKRPSVESEAFEPTSAYLLLTADCNLRCQYCFSKGGDSKTNLSVTVAKAAIDIIVENARRRFIQPKIRYHGGGEPTLRWDVLTETAMYLKAEAARHSLTPHLGINTNGVLPEYKLKWMAENLDAIYISFDGPQDSHDLQRPTFGGGGSYAAVWKTMQWLSEAGKQFAVRSTITKNNFGHMAKIVDMLSPFGVSGIELEPLTVCGRAYTSQSEAPSPTEYIQGYKEAYARAKHHGMDILYSGVRIDAIGSIFCGAAGRNFAVTPSGHSTFCHRVSDVSEPGAEHYIYGKYSEETGTFIFDREKIGAMKGMSCEKSTACQDCFAKWNCGGGCYAQNHEETGKLMLDHRTDRCTMTRELTKFRIVERIQLANPIK
ncbi:MAG: radical SAM protein [Acidobacteria bacterium]|nr:radical SAM protein [Acidobacteriota bacterium]